MSTESIPVFSEDFARRIVDTVVRANTALRSPSQRRKRPPQPPDNGDNEGNTPNGTGGGGCCCNEMDCLPAVTDYYGDAVATIPTEYYFRPTSFLCHCQPAEDANALVTLAVTDDPTIYESEPIQCQSGTANDPCSNERTYTWHMAGTNTGTWTWTKTSPCDNTRTWYAAYPFCPDTTACQYDTLDGLTWHLTDDSGCTGSCECAEPINDPADINDTSTGVCTPSPATLEWYYLSETNPSCCTPAYPVATPTSQGETTTTMCSVGTESFDWVLTSQTNPGYCLPPKPAVTGTEVEDDTTTTSCDYAGGWTSNDDDSNADCCDPDAPDYDGEEEGQIATVDCELAEGDPIYKPAFWRLTIEGPDYYGCDTTHIDFLIDDVVIFTECLVCPSGARSKPFCPSCVNTFHICTCGPLQCDGTPPTVICLHPEAFPTASPGTIHCGTEWEREAPPYLVGTFTGNDCDCDVHDPVIFSASDPIALGGVTEQVGWETDWFPWSTTGEGGIDGCLIWRVKFRYSIFQRLAPGPGQSCMYANLSIYVDARDWCSVGDEILNSPLVSIFGKDIDVLADVDPVSDRIAITSTSSSWGACFIPVRLCGTSLMDPLKFIYLDITEP